MALGAHIPAELFMTKNKEWKFLDGDGGHVSRFVGAELEFHDFTVVPSAAVVLAFRSLLQEWGASVIQDHHNAEVQLAPAKGEKFDQQVEAVCAQLAAMRAKCTSISGLHLHVDARDMKFSHLGRVMVLYSKMEPLLVKTQPFSRMQGKFCKPTGKDLGEGWGERRPIVEQEKLFEEKSKAWVSTQGVGLTAEQVARYKAVNFAAWYKYGTIEIRFHEGTLNPEEIIRWATFWSKFVDYASATPIDTLREFPRTLTALTKALGKESVSYISERIAKYKAQWTAERVAILMPKKASGPECDLCRTRPAPGECCGMSLCAYHMDNH